MVRWHNSAIIFIVAFVLVCTLSSGTAQGQQNSEVPQHIVDEQTSLAAEQDFNTLLVKTILETDVTASAKNGNILFAANLNIIYSLDVSDPVNPIVLDTVHWWRPPANVEYCYGMYYRNGYLYVSSKIHGLLVYDVSDPANLEQVNLVPVEPNYGLAAIREYRDFLLVSDEAHVLVFDLAEPWNPVHIFDVLMYGSPSDASTGPPLDISGDMMFTEAWDTLRLYKLYENGEILLQKTYPEFTRLWGAIGINKNHLFITRTNFPKQGTSLHCYAINVDYDLTLVSSIEVSLSPTQMYFQGNSVYVLDTDASQFRVFDFSDVNNPVYIARYGYSPFNKATHIEFFGNYVYMTTSGSGIAIIKVDIPTSTSPLSSPASFNLSPAYPNPFSGSTNITYSLPSQQQVSLEVYNTLGRKVQTLYSGLREPGTHNARLNASGLAAGTYQVVLRSGEGVKTQMVVVR